MKITHKNTKTPYFKGVLVDISPKNVRYRKSRKNSYFSADKEYDGVDVITYLQDKGIKPIIVIRNHWKEETKQYKDTDLIYTYDGKVSIVEDNGDIIPLKYLGYDKVKNTSPGQRHEKIIS